MLKALRQLIICLTLTFGAAFHSGATSVTGVPIAHSSNSHIADSIRSLLPAAGTAADSLPLLQNLFDLAERDQLNEIAMSIRGVARRCGNTDASADILRQLANINYSNDSVLTALEKEALEQPDTPDRLRLLTFIRLIHTSLMASSPSFGSNLPGLRDLVEKSYDDAGSLHQSVIDAYAVCACLANLSKGELLTQYIDRLKKLIDRLPADHRYIRYFYLNQAASLYTYCEQPSKAIAADREMLALIADIEAIHHSKGRIYRNYDTARFSALRRMMLNSSELSDGETEEIYQALEELGKRNSEIGETMRSYPRSRSAYLMKKGQYAEAIPLLQKAIALESRPLQRRFFLKMLRDAALAVGDRVTLLEAAVEYSNMLDEYIDRKSAEHYIELQARYDIDELRQLNRELSIASDKTRSLWIMICLAIAVAMLIAILAVIYVNYRRVHAISASLEERNHQLRKERDESRRIQAELTEARSRAAKSEQLKADFVSEISHEILTPVSEINDYTRLIFECIPADQQRYMERFVKNVKLNCELLKLLINDMIGISQFDKSKAIVEIGPASSRTLCLEALHSIEPQVAAGVEVIADSSNLADIAMVTDGKRIIKVLENLLSNAAKFTSRGSISLACRAVDNDGKAMVEFSVTDTGIGIPDDKSEEIFRRFEKLGKNTTQGIGLGLPICRMIARMLQGEVAVDSSYTKGARFIFTTPADLTAR